MSSATSFKQGYRLSVNDFKNMILGANYFFEQEKERINALNVFPVPDGDTGTNMSMTLGAAVKGTLAYKGKSIGELSEVVASHALMGARGNSGVILSQILKGIARGLQKKEHISPAELSKAFQYGVVYGYKAVSTPVEGTILTVARETARGIRNAVSQGKNLHKSMEEAIKSGREALERTTEMLPALKEAGVVDAGGLGLLVFLEGCLYALKQSVNDLLHPGKKKIVLSEHSMDFEPSPHRGIIINIKQKNLKYPYCTEVIVQSNSGHFEGLKKELQSQGDSLLLATDNRAAKIHIHTASPGSILETAIQYGSLHDIKIDNMHDQQMQTSQAPPATEIPGILPASHQKEKGEAGVISVSFGKGFRDIFLSLGADEVIFGGQTMNPKVEDILNAVQNLSQQSAIILPNNKNIIMVAEQVKSLSEKNVEVIETKTLPEGLSALLAYDAGKPVEKNVEVMNEGMTAVKTGLITYATRDVVINGSPVKEGQYLGLDGENILTHGESIEQTTLNLVEGIVDVTSDIVSVFYGRDITGEEARELVEKLERNHPELEIELQLGGQPIYYYIISVE